MQNSNPKFEQQKEFLENNLSDILNNHNNTSIQPTNHKMKEDNENKTQYLGTLAIILIIKITKIV